MPEWTKLQAPGIAGDSQLTDQLRSNLCVFLDYALLSAGFFMNVIDNNQYPFGSLPSILRMSNDIRYPKGTVWDAPKTNWCWEQDIEYSSQPISVTGVFINSQFYPIGSTGYQINYMAGRVIFDNPLPENSFVQAVYSYKYYNVYPDTTQWFKELTQGTWRIDDPQFYTSDSGIWSTFPESRSQLPAVVVEISPTTRHSPLGLGGGQWIWKDALIHIFSETAFDRDNLVDILSYQCDKRLFLFDKNLISKNDAFPLDAYGSLVNPSSIYPNLINNYAWRDLYIQDIAVQRSDNNPQSIYYGVARWTMKVNMPDII